MKCYLLKGFSINLFKSSQFFKTQNKTSIRDEFLNVKNHLRTILETLKNRGNLKKFSTLTILNGDDIC